MTEWRVENWLSDSPHRAIEYSEYWNDEQNEQDKAWNILDGDFTKMESYLAQIGLVEDLRECLDACRARRGSGLGGVGIDLAAGNLWAAPHLLGSGDIEKLYCLEFSKHRLLKLGPKVLEHYQVPNDKVVLVYGSFYDLHLADGSVDFALLSAAFHHAEDPNRLLSEIRRVLKPDGVLMVIGEHIVPEPYSLGYLKVCAKHVAKAVIAASTPAAVQRRLLGRVLERRSPIPSTRALFPTDPVLGDHLYSLKEYRSMFAAHRFRMTHLLKPGSAFQSFVLRG